MTIDVFRFCFSPEVPLGEAEMTLDLATYAVEGLFGSARVRLETNYHLDPPRNVILLDATNEVGATVARVFTALLLREFGEEGFRVERIEAQEVSLAA